MSILLEIEIFKLWFVVDNIYWFVSGRIKILKFATSEARTHDLEIMRITRCRLRHSRVEEEITTSFLKEKCQCIFLV